MDRMADETKSLEILLSYGLDASSIQATTAGVNSTTAALANQQQQLRANRMELRELGQAFTAIGLAGAAIYVPAIAASQAYLKAAGNNEALSRAWLADTDKIKQSTIDIGRVVTEGLLPGYTQLANIMSSFAAFAQQNPQLVQAAVGLAGGLVAIGAMGKIFVEADRAVVDIQLIAATLMKKAADEQLAAGTAYGVTGGNIGPAAASTTAGGMFVSMLAPLVIPIIAAVGAGAIYNMFKNANAPGALQLIPEANADIYALFNKPILDKMGAFGQAIEKFDQSVLHLQLGATGATAGGTGTGASSANPSWYNTGLTDYTAYETKLTDLQATYQKDQLSEQQSYQTTSLQDTLTYEKLQQTQQASFDTANAQAAQTYQDTQKDELEKFNQSQSDTIRNFQESELQAQESYQNSMADLDQSHRDKLQQLSQSHNWLGMDQENKTYAEQKAQKTRDFNEADAQRRAQNAQTLADAQRNFTEQQAEEKANYDASTKQRAAAFKLQQKTDAANFTDEMNQLADNHIVKMAQLKANYDDQKTLEMTAFQDQMNVLLAITTAAEVGMSNQYNAFLKSMGVNAPTNTALTGVVGGEKKFTHDSGGYFMPGMARNASGANEWVLAPDTVKYAESIVGGRLTQQNLIAAMISGRGGAAGGSYSNSNTVNMSGLTAQDRLLVGSMMNKALQEFARKQLS